jgi:hypothetical protein
VQQLATASQLSDARSSNALLSIAKTRALRQSRQVLILSAITKLDAVPILPAPAALPPHPLTSPSMAPMRTPPSSCNPCHPTPAAPEKLLHPALLHGINITTTAIWRLSTAAAVAMAGCTAPQPALPCQPGAAQAPSCALLEPQHAQLLPAATQLALCQACCLQLCHQCLNLGVLQLHQLLQLAHLGLKDLVDWAKNVATGWMLSSDPNVPRTAHGWTLAACS